jgi:hypothetical protein
LAEAAVTRAVGNSPIANVTDCQGRTLQAKIKSRNCRCRPTAFPVIDDLKFRRARFGGILAATPSAKRTTE